MGKLISNNFQVSFLPWAEFKKTITLGPITFGPYNKEADQRIRDTEIKTHLDKYFKSYVDHKGKPVDTITVCSHGDANFRRLNDQEQQDIRNAVDVLIFAAIATQTQTAVSINNRSWAPPSADIFELLNQEFRHGGNYIIVKAGSLKSVWEIGEITFPMPLAKGGGFWEFEEELINGFDKCFSAKFPLDVRERLFRSLEWFRLAHIEGGQVSELSKVVMMATAFEILLQFPKERKRKHFEDYMENHIASDEFNKDTRINRKGKPTTLSLAGCWAWDFYELRSRIVHGDSIPSYALIYQGRIPHIIVADLIFLECVMRELFANKCIGKNIRSSAKKLFPNAPEETAIDSLFRLRFGFANIHGVLGWIP